MTVGPKQRLINQLLAENETLRGRVCDLKAKLKESTDRMAMVAEGTYYTSESSELSSAESRAKRTCVYGLAKIARMSER